MESSNNGTSDHNAQTMTNHSQMGTEGAPSPCGRREEFIAWLMDHRLTLLGLTLLTIVAYAPVVRFDYVNWDDPWYIVNNDLIKSWHPANLWRVMTESVARNFAPLTIFTFLIEHTLWGLWPGGYHLGNLLLHLVNGWLVFALVRRLSGNELLAWTVAAVFVLHPVQVESVAWISSRKTLLSALFMLASCECWLRPQRTSRQEFWGMIWLSLGLLSKASTVVVPPIVIAYDLIVAKKKFPESLARQVVPGFLSLMLILLTMSAQTTIVGGVRGHIGMSKLEILAIDSTLLWRYVGMLLWPANLAVLYDPPMQGILPLIALALAGWLLVAWGLYRLRHRAPLLTFAGVSWFLLFVPVMNLFPITTLMNDRYLYLPIVPLTVITMAAGQAGLTALRQRWHAHSQTVSSPVRDRVVSEWGLVVASTVLVAGLGASTFAQLDVWRNPMTLWSHALEQTPSLPVVHIQWAITLQKQGETTAAVHALEHALGHCDPDPADRERILRMLTEWNVEAGG